MQIQVEAALVYWKKTRERTYIGTQGLGGKRGIGDEKMQTEKDRDKGRSRWNEGT